MKKPSLCIIFEATGPYNAIGKVAMAQAEAALEAGWDVSVVAKYLHESLRGRVEWLKLFVPRRGFALQWLTARHFIQQALGRRKFDVVHGHQPQIADLCDLYQCHFLTRAAYGADCLEDKKGIRRVAEWLQNRMVLHAEDRIYRNPGRGRFLFNSHLTKETFARYYGLPAKNEVFLYPAPSAKPISEIERRETRLKFQIPESGKPVIGFLGGLQERKGVRRVEEALRGHPDLFLLIGGLYSDRYEPSGLEGRSRAVGLVDSSEFYAACDVLVLPSHFEPFGLVALEAASRGVPVIATPEVGALPHLLEAGAGVAWVPGKECLADLVRQVMARRGSMQLASLKWAESRSSERHAADLMGLYERVVRAKRAEQIVPLPFPSEPMQSAATL